MSRYVYKCRAKYTYVACFSGFLGRCFVRFGVRWPSYGGLVRGEVLGVAEEVLLPFGRKPRADLKVRDGPEVRQVWERLYQFGDLFG